MSSLTFEDLLGQVAKGQGQDLTALAAERAKLAGEMEKLEHRLAGTKANLAIVMAKLQEPVRQATRAAQLMGIMIPAEYQIHSGKANGKTANGGSYRWEPGPLPGTNRVEDLTAQEWGVSRAMWAFSKGSNGSVGQAGEGVLSSAEFWALAKAQTGKAELEKGEVLALTLPNGRPVKVSRLR